MSLCCSLYIAAETVHCFCGSFTEVLNWEFTTSFTVSQITKWLNEEAEDYLSYKEYGDSAPSTQVLLEEHTKFEEAVKVCTIE